MPKKQREQSFWEALLDMGILRVSLLINGIGALIIIISMVILRWFTKNW